MSRISPVLIKFMVLQWFYVVVIIFQNDGESEPLLGPDERRLSAGPLIQQPQSSARTTYEKKLDNGNWTSWDRDDMAAILQTTCSWIF